MPVYWADNFNSAAALSVNYGTVIDMTKTAGIGPDGSQAIIGTGTNSQKYYAEVRKTVTVDSRKGYVEVDIKPNEAIDQGGWSYIDVYWVGGIYSGGTYAGSPDFGDISLFNQSYTEIGAETNAVSDGVWTTLGMEFETSSISGGARNADGWMIVTLNGVDVINVSGLILGNYHAVNNPNNYWYTLSISPQGTGDNLYVADVPAAGVATASVFFG
jgi:hypothetical protein